MIRKELFKEISNLIGNGLESLVEEVVELSNKKKILYHGIKRCKDVEKIERQGILPLTPESGPCSFWSTGTALFYPEMDSPFFNYSGGRSLEPNTCELNLATASYDLLLDLDLSLPDYEEDSQIKISEAVPYYAITIINVKLRCPQNEEILRKHRQVAEHMILESIQEYLFQGFPLGKINKVKDF